MYYLGIDVQKGQSVFHVVDDLGKKIKSGKVATKPSDFADLARHQTGLEGVEVALETGNMTFELSRAMTKAGADVFVVDAYQNALIAKSTKKTDKQDAKMLAEQRRLSMLPPHRVYVPSARAEQLRHLLSHRATLVKSRTSLSNRAMRIGERVSHVEKKSRYSYAPAWKRLLKAAEERRISRMIVAQLAEEAWMVQKQIRDMERSIEEHLKEHFPSQAQLLRTIPGIGPITCAALIAQVEDIGRFKSARQLCRYLGLTPVVRESGSKRSGRGICKSGNGRLRGYFTQAALNYLCHAKKDDPLFQWYEAIKRRRGWKKARVALARKLVSISFGVWRHETPYDPKKAVVFVAN